MTVVLVRSIITLILVVVVAIHFSKSSGVGKRSSSNQHIRERIRGVSYRMTYNVAGSALKSI